MRISKKMYAAGCIVVGMTFAAFATVQPIQILGLLLLLLGIYEALMADKSEG